MEVLLYMYDLSRGTAALLSQSLIGHHLDAIWHTSIVLGGIECYFDAHEGIVQGPAGKTRFGKPLRIQSLGITTRSVDEWNVYVRCHTMSRFHKTKYHLLENNCNHYTEEATSYLGVQSLPACVREMMNIVLSTPWVRAFFDSASASNSSTTSAIGNIKVAEDTHDCNSVLKEGISPIVYDANMFISKVKQILQASPGSHGFIIAMSVWRSLEGFLEEFQDINYGVLQIGKEWTHVQNEIVEALLLVGFTNGPNNENTSCSLRFTKLEGTLSIPMLISAVSEEIIQEELEEALMISVSGTVNVDAKNDVSERTLPESTFDMAVGGPVKARLKLNEALISKSSINILKLSMSSGIDTMKELMDWIPPSVIAKSHVKLLLSTQRTLKCSTHSQERVLASSRTLLCHDCRGGYLESDRYPQGKDITLSTENPFPGYLFRHWQCIDTFVYFSHHRVTIPPAVWIDVAHSNSVPVLGTFITEWSEGVDECSNFLNSEANVAHVASQLANIAMYYNFDGWLVNIENPVSPRGVEHLLHFLSLLTATMHSLHPASHVLWYDSVTVQGKLQWQSCLSSLNSSFFELCDGIFTDYHWTEAHLQHSIKMAGELSHKVYVGIDIFCRNSPRQKPSIELVAESYRAVTDTRSLSSALFAPGWTWETSSGMQINCDGSSQGTGFISRDNLLWSTLFPTHVTPCITSLPFSTNFNAGFGIQTCRFGSPVAEALPWQHLSQQELCPIGEDKKNSEKGAPYIESQPCMNRAFHGGCSWEGKLHYNDISCTFSESDSPRLAKTTMFGCCVNLKNCKCNSSESGNLIVEVVFS